MAQDTPHEGDSTAENTKNERIVEIEMALSQPDGESVHTFELTETVPESEAERLIKKANRNVGIEATMRLP